MLEMKVRLVYSPPKRALVLLGYPDIYRAADHVMEVLEARPLALEGIDARLYEHVRKKHDPHRKYLGLLPPGFGWLFVEFGGDTDGRKRATRPSALARAHRVPAAPAFGQDRHGSDRAAAPLGRARVGPRRDGVRAGRTGRVGGMGRLGGGPGGRGRLPPRPSHALESLRLRLGDVRPLRHGVHPLPHQLRPQDGPRDREVAALHGGGDRPRRHEVPRLDLRGARGRAIEGRVSLQDVRARARRRVP